MLSVLLASIAISCPPCDSLTWVTHGTLYGDNTEFFTPYRVGETILGGTVASYLRMRTGPRTALNIGFIADHRSGSEQFAHPFRPVISFQHVDGGTSVDVGSYFPERRHGYIEPLEVSTLELTRPIEYGLQLKERRSWIDGEIFINWQKLNLATQREVFDFGSTVYLKPNRFISIVGQLHGVHHGGQLFNAGEPVTNNVARAVGVTLADTLPFVSRASLSVFRAAAGGGTGTYVRGGITPFNWVELFGIWWKGRDYVATEGDNNYNSVGEPPTYYRADREYLEIGFLRRTTIERSVTFDAELRFHQFDGGIPSISIGHSRWEYSYRFVIRAPFEVGLR